MKINAPLFLLLATLIVLTSCQSSESNKQAAKDSEPVVVDGHNSQNSLDWSGLYRGYLPCASCPGILTQIILHSDGNYVEQTRYSDQPDIFTNSGTVKWGPEGGIIGFLDDVSRQYRYFKVIENGLLSLDQNKQVVSGELADKYRLKKMNLNLLQAPWTLLSMGDNQLSKELQKRVEINFKEDGDVNGQAPCNRFFAKIEHRPDTKKLSFSDVGGTKMACAELSLEQLFFKLLSEVDSYEIKNNLLLLKSQQQLLMTFKSAFLETGIDKP